MPFLGVRRDRHLYTGACPVSARPAREVLPLLTLALSLALGAHAGAGAAIPSPVLRLLPIALGLALILLLAALAARVVATRRLLARRVRLAVLAPDSFDPSLDSVLRFAAQLSRTRRATRGWLDSRASAVRVLLDADPEGRMRYSLAVPERALPALRAALGAYEQVELRRVEPPDDEPEQAVVRAELRLARSSSEPLAHLGLEPDLLQPFAGVVASLDIARGERAQIALDLLPMSPGRQRRVRRRLLRGGEAPQPAAEVSAGLLHERRGPAQATRNRAARDQLAAKVLRSEPLFELQLLVRCSGATRGVAAQRLQGLLGCFDALAAANSLRVVGLRLIGVAFLGSDLPLLRCGFDRRMRTGLFAPTRRGVVGAREIAGLLKPPSVHCASPSVLRLGPAVFPAPRELPTFAPDQSRLVPLGRVQAERGQRVVGLELADSFFTYIVGRSRWGKSELAIGQFLHLVRCGHGGMFLDPHEDAIARIKGFLTEEGLARRVTELDLVGPRAQESQPSWNLLALGGLPSEEVERRVEAVVDAFASALGWSEVNNRALTLTTQATAALADLAQRLPADCQPTLFQIPTLLANDGWRGAVLPFLSAQRRQFFLERFPRLSQEAITPITNLIDRIRSSSSLAALLGGSACTYEISREMDQGRIVLACPGSGGAKDRLVANLLVFDLLHAAKARARVAPERRRPFHVFLDEVQTYDGASSGSLAALLEQTAKYGIRAFLLNQNPERLTSQTLNALTTNRSHLIATALNSHAASLIAREWGGQPPPSALASLPRYSFLAQVTHQGELARPFLIEGVRVEEQLGIEPQVDRLREAQALIDRASNRASVPATLGSLETLDGRILDALAARRDGSNGAVAVRGAPVLPLPDTGGHPR
jgi:hypothetical protein